MEIAIMFLLFFKWTLPLVTWQTPGNVNIQPWVRPLGLTGAQTQVRRREPRPIVWKQHGRMDVVLTSVVVTPGPGMIMFSLKTLLEPARKPFTEQEKAEKFVKLEELDGCRIKPTSYQGVQSRAPLFSVSLQNVLHLSLQDSDSDTLAATCLGKLQTAHVQHAD